MMNSSNEISYDSISQWLQNGTIFITGATGFIGRNLIMKLLKSANNIKCIYVLVRRKSDDCKPQDRVNKLFNTERINDQRIHVIEGNLKQENFGLDDITLNKINNEVNIIFHVAATINFTAPLSHAVDVNVRGTNTLLEMASNMKHLHVFVHVSTAFCQCQIYDMVEEIIYEAPVKPNQVLQMTDEELNNNQIKFLGDWPNTYCWSKSIAEELVADKKWVFPRVILRPSIVTPAIREPYFSWSVEHSLITGAYIVWNLGIFKILNLRSSGIANIIPVDVVTNACILSAYQHAKQKNNDILVVNCTNSCTKPVIWQEIVEKTKIKTTENYLYYLIETIFLELIPLYFFFLIDPRLKHIYYINRKLESTVRYFGKRDWYFRYSNMNKLIESLNKEDELIYSLDISNADWFEMAHQSGNRIFQQRIDNDHKFKTLIQAYQIWLHFIFLIYVLIIYKLCEFFLNIFW